jgi:hypothetical protein
MSESEVARLRQEIEAECIAAQQGLQGFAAVARHAIITHRYNQMGALTDQLAQYVGEQEATAISTQIYMHVMDEPGTQKDQEQVSQARAEASTPLQVDPSDSAHPEGSGVQDEETITVRAHLKREGVQFLRDRACHIEHHSTGDLITFPAGSRKVPLSRVSQSCSVITFPDATEITRVDEDDASCTLLLIDMAKQQTTSLTC